MTRLRCGPLAAWANAWLHGTVAFDDVLVAASVGASAPVLVVTPAASMPPDQASADQGRQVPLGEILIAWRQTRAEVRLVLPIAGDVRGLPGPIGFRAAAIDAGQTVIGSGIATLPFVVDHRPSSAPPTLTWRRFDVACAPDDFIAIADAQYELTEAIRECASSLARLDLATAAGPLDLGDELSSARRAGERINLPPGFPPRAVSLIAQAERMAAVLALAGTKVTGGTAVTDHRAVALSPLVTAVRRARLAGYNAHHSG